MDDSHNNVADEDIVANINLMVVGQGAVGKSCFLQTYFEDIQQTVKSATIGLDVRRHVTNIRGIPLCLQFYDTAGSERFRAIIKGQFARAHGVILMFDLTSRDTFLRLGTWLSEFRVAGRPLPVIVLVANKQELTSRHTVTSAEVTQFADDNALRAYSLSAFDRRRVCDVIEELAMDVLRCPRLYSTELESCQTTLGRLIRLYTRRYAREAANGDCSERVAEYEREDEG